MLLQFVVKNYLSFQKESMLNLLPAKRLTKHKNHEETWKRRGKEEKVLPLAALYGANASGKSNLVKAISFAQELIINGTRSEEVIAAIPFRLSHDTVHEPSRFEFVITHDGVLYTYGFAATSREIKEEWLFASSDSYEVRLFERVTGNGKAILRFGNKLANTSKERQRLQFVAEGTRANQLFLTEANERNVEALKPLMDWFRNNLFIIWPEALYSRLVLQAHSDQKFTEFLTTFLKIADTGIQNINLEAMDLDPVRHLSQLSDDNKKDLFDTLEKAPDHCVYGAIQNNFFAIKQENDKKLKFLTLQTTHQTPEGPTVNFKISDESDGTHRMMHLAPALLNIQTSENVYIIDELDRSLHPLLCRLYIDAFLESIIEQKSRGQIIFTTHETSLLDLSLLRRDEIWFVEKDKQGGSHLTSLAEYKYNVRSDLKVDKGYLNGRFGAIPFVGDSRSLFS